MIRRINEYGRLVMFSHTMFSLPFGLLSMVWAVGGWPNMSIFVYILVALVAARTGANAFNRIADKDIDAKNPRTATRSLPQQRVKVREAWAITIVSFAILALCAYLLNPLCLALLPLALTIFVVYSYTKRFTWTCHFILGLACGGAPVGAWAAASGSLSLVAFALGGAVCFWVAGFDIIYATADIEFDRKERLHSVPARFGREKALKIAALSHAASLGCLLFIPLVASRGPLYFAGIAVAAGLMALEHAGARGFVRLRVNFINYGINQIVSLVFFGFAIADVARGF